MFLSIICGEELGSFYNKFLFLFLFFFYICTMHLDIIKVYYSPTNAQVIVLKNNIKIAPTCFGAVTPSSGSSLSVLAKVTVVKICQSYFNVNFNIVFKTITCAFVGE
jgi:hypothetical protein